MLGFRTPLYIHVKIYDFKHLYDVKPDLLRLPPSEQEEENAIMSDDSKSNVKKAFNFEEKIEEKKEEEPA